MRRRDPTPLHRFLSTLGSADLLVVCGQGSMGDATRAHAGTVLGTLELAMASGVPTAMMGQGMGPMEDSALRARAATVLPKVGLIALREGRRGTPLLQDLGVSPRRVLVTGDDALELALAGADSGPGWGLGVNVRISGNAGVAHDFLALLRPVVREESHRRAAPLIPVPIARGAAADATVLRELLGGDPEGSIDLDTPAKVVAQIGRCRVLLTGAYHAAVFALAQGVPVVALAETEYYRWKFEGLRDQFGPDCQIVALEEPDLPSRIRGALAEAWERAGTARDELRGTAAALAHQGRAAYQRLPELLPEAGVGSFAPERAAR